MKIQIRYVTLLRYHFHLFLCHARAHAGLYALYKQVLNERVPSFELIISINTPYVLYTCGIQLMGNLLS